MRSFLLIALLCPFFLFAQKLKVNQIDKFTHQKRIQTAKGWLKVGFSNTLAVYFRTVDSTLFINLTGIGDGANVIGENEKAVFLLDNDSEIIGFSPSIQDYDLHQSSSGIDKTFNHQYLITLDDLKTFSRHKVKSIRKYSTSGYHDFEIPERNQDEIKKQALLILKYL